MTATTLRRLALLALSVFLLVPGASRAQDEAAKPAANPLVAFDTSHGRFVVEVFSDGAPESAANFLEYVRSGFYDGTIFHRVIDGFVIQGGGFTREMRRKESRPPIRNEADNGLRNLRGTLSMARRNDPHSANSQFFVNLVDNASLDHRSKTGFGWGYAVFARVVDGMEVVDEIGASPTGVSGGMQDVPIVPVVVDSARVLGPDA